jgi:hypothetical protein
VQAVNPANSANPGAEYCIMGYDAYLARSMPVPWLFSALYTLPVADLLKGLGENFKRQYFDIDTDDSLDVRGFVRLLRAALKNGLYKPPALPPAAANGDYIKWIVQGIVSALEQSSGNTYTAPAFNPPPWQTAGENAANKNSDYTLRLCLSLASWANSAFKGQAFKDAKEFEIRDASFSQMLTIVPEDAVSSAASSPPVPGTVNAGDVSAAVQSFPGFMENAGFSINGVQPLLFTLACANANFIYLADVNYDEGDMASPRSHYAAAVLVPYFTSTGVFDILCFENGGERRFIDWRRDFQGRSVRLFKVPVEGKFIP